jgi:hypothetical protein
MPILARFAETALIASVNLLNDQPFPRLSPTLLRQRVKRLLRFDFKLVDVAQGARWLICDQGEALVAPHSVRLFTPVAAVCHQQVEQSNLVLHRPPHMSPA